MTRANFEFIDSLVIPEEHFFADQQAAIETSVYEDIVENARYTGNTAEDCEALYAEWIKRYRGQHPRPEFKL